MVVRWATQSVLTHLAHHLITPPPARKPGPTCGLRNGVLHNFASAGQAKSLLHYPDDQTTMPALTGLPATGGHRATGPTQIRSCFIHSVSIHVPAWGMSAAMIIHQFVTEHPSDADSVPPPEAGFRIFSQGCRHYADICMRADWCLMHCADKHPAPRSQSLTGIELEGVAQKLSDAIVQRRTSPSRASGLNYAASHCLNARSTPHTCPVLDLPGMFIGIILSILKPFGHRGVE